MSHAEITAECARLTKAVKDKAKSTVKKTKVEKKTRFVI